MHPASPPQATSNSNDSRGRNPPRNAREIACALRATHAIFPISHPTSSDLQFVTGKLSPRALAAQSAEPARQVSHAVLTSNMIYMIYAARAPDLMTLHKNVGLRAQTSKAEN